MRIKNWPWEKITSYQSMIKIHKYGTYNFNTCPFFSSEIFELSVDKKFSKILGRIFIGPWSVNPYFDLEKITGWFDVRKFPVMGH